LFQAIELLFRHLRIVLWTRRQRARFIARGVVGIVAFAAELSP
jgi:hypothetical protein